MSATTRPVALFGSMEAWIEIWWWEGGWHVFPPLLRSCVLTWCSFPMRCLPPAGPSRVGGSEVLMMEEVRCDIQGVRGGVVDLVVPRLRCSVCLVVAAALQTTTDCPFASRFTFPIRPNFKTFCKAGAGGAVSSYAVWQTSGPPLTCKTFSDASDTDASLSLPSRPFGIR